jgi:hypothetical protein
MARIASNLRGDPKHLYELRRKRVDQLRRQIMLMVPTTSDPMDIVISKCNKKKKLRAKLRFYDTAIFREKLVHDLAEDIAKSLSKDASSIEPRIHRVVTYWIAKEIKKRSIIPTPHGPKLETTAIFDYLSCRFARQIQKGKKTLKFPKNILE